MIFLSIVASIGVLFLLNTLWRLFLESRKSGSSGEKAEIIHFVRRGSPALSRIDEPRPRSTGKAV